MDEEPAAKRAKNGDAESGSFKMKPDLLILVEGQAFEVHSLILVMVSPVFRKMLEAGMSEQTQREVTLPDKRADEFRTFWDIVQPMTAVTVTKDNAVYLSRWADEYQVARLKDQCEEFMVKHMAADVESLHHAILYSLTRRCEQCVQRISNNIPAHLDKLISYGPQMPPDVLRKIWPGLCKAAGVKDLDMPGEDVVLAMFPFVVAAARASSYQRLCNEVSHWPAHISYSLNGRTNAGSQASEWLNRKVVELRGAGVIP